MIRIIGMTVMREGTRFAIRQQRTLWRTSGLTRMLAAVWAINVAVAVSITVAVLISVSRIAVSIAIAVGITVTSFLVFTVSTALLWASRCFDVYSLSRREPRSRCCDRNGCFWSSFRYCCYQRGRCGGVP